MSEELKPGAFRIHQINPNATTESEVDYIMRNGDIDSRDCIINSKDYAVEFWAHRYDCEGTAIYAGDVVLIDDIIKAVVRFNKENLQWMVQYFVGTEEKLSQVYQTLANFDCDENGRINMIKIIGNIHQELAKDD